MIKNPLTIAGSLALIMASASSAHAVGPASIAKSMAGAETGSIIVLAHSVYEAKHKLQNLGYYAIRTERASEPYSFAACKRGQRFHIHMDYYGDLVQVDEAGSCQTYGGDYGSRYYGRQPRYDSGSRYGGYRRYRGDDGY